VKKAISNKDSIKDKNDAYETYAAAVAGKSNSIAREVATDILGEPVFWDWDCKFRNHWK
jgi:isocitrate lyase